MPELYNPLTRRHQTVSEADFQYLSRPLAGDASGTRMVRNPLDGKNYPVPEAEFDFLSVPGRSLTDTYAPMATPQANEPDTGVELADYGKAIMAGGASVGQGFGWLAKQVGHNQIGSMIEELGRNAVDYWTDSLSDSAKDALSREFISKNDQGGYEWGDATLHTVGLMGAQSLLGTAAGAGAGAGITKVLQLFANPLGRSVLAAAARSGSVQATRKLGLVDGILTRGVTNALDATKRLRGVDSVLGALGFGVGEGLISGTQAGSGVEAAIKMLPPETLLNNQRYQQILASTDDRMTDLERHQYAADTIASEAATEAGFQSGLLTSLLGAPMGAYFGRILGQSGRLGSTRLASTAVGAAGEAAQEALQSAGEAAIGVRARQRAGEQDLDMLEQAINQAIGGAAAGGALGGAIGAVDFRPETAPRGTSGKPDTATPLKNAAMRAAMAGAPKDAVVAEVSDNSRPLLDRIKKLRALAETAATTPPPEPAEPAPPTYADVLALPAAPSDAASPSQEGVVAATGEAAPKQRIFESPLDIESKIDEMAHSAATSPLNPAPPPTPEQIEAENYEAGRIKGSEVGMRSLDFVVEHPRGTNRNGVDMTSHYGRIPGAIGGDGMSLDFFMGNADNDTVYLYHHIDPEGRFTQSKAFVGFASEAAVKEELEHFYRGFERNPRARGGPIVELTKPQFEQWVNAGKTGVAHPDSGLKPPARVEGSPTRAVTANGEAIEAQYALVEAGELISSHTLTGKPNPNFPQELQPRDRSRAGLRQWIVETAERFEPALAVEGASAGEGAPIVGPDNVIESGNGRTMVITKLYLDKSTKYRDYLKANVEKFGIKPEAVDAMSRPMLVRVRRGRPLDMDARARFAQEANRPTLSTFSATEQANADARALTNEEIGVFNPSPDGNVLADSNRLFTNAFLGKLPATERAGLMTADGGPTRQLSNRIQAAIFSRAYQDDRLLALMAEEANPDVRNVISALTAAAPAFARARAAGTLAQADVVTPLVGAIEVVRAARNKGQAVAEYLDQQGLFEQIPPDVDRMARFIDANLRSARKMGEAFTAMASFLETEGQRRTSGSLFGEEAPLDVNLAMQAANQRMAAGGAQGQGALFSQRPDAERPPAPPGTDANPLPNDLTQEEKAERLHAMGEENFAWVQPIMDKINRTFGAIGEANIKTARSLIAKANRPGILAMRPWWNVEYVRDSFRFRTAVDTLEDMDKVVTMFLNEAEAGGHPVRIIKVDTEKLVQPKEWGWRMMPIDLVMPNGQIAEYYISTKELIEANEGVRFGGKYNGNGGLHKAFENWRYKDQNALTDEEVVLFQEDVAVSKRGYDSAWEEYLARTGQTESDAFASAKRLETALASRSSTKSSPSSSPVSGMGNEPRANQAPPDLSAEKTPSTTSTREPSRSMNASTPESIAQVERVRSWLAPDLAALEPIIRANVVATTAELPDPSAPPDVEGAYTQDGQVWFVAANIPTEARARAVGRHEVFGHMAIERNGKLKVRIEAVSRAIRAGNLKALARDVRRRQGLLPALVEAKEVVALMAERGVKSPLLGGLRTALRDVGRDLGIDMPIDEAELDALVAVAARDLRHDAAVMRDFRAAADLPAVQALNKAEPTTAEILAGLDAIYGDSDTIDHDYRTTASGKRVEPGMFALPPGAFEVDRSSDGDEIIIRGVDNGQDVARMVLQLKGSTLHITQTDVFEERRGEGIGQQLIEQAYIEARDAGFNLVSDNMVSAAQLRAYESLKRKGWTIQYTDQAKVAEALSTGKSALHVLPDKPVVKKIAPPKGAALYQRAFHGSPHEFERFSLDAIGTGEGAQSYGWGLYFSSMREIGEHYRKALSSTISYRGKPLKTIGPEDTQHLEWGGPEHRALALFRDAPDLPFAQEYIKSAQAGHAAEPTEVEDPETLAAAQRLIDSGEIAAAAPGRLYEVEIPDSNELLDWERNLVDQPAALDPVLDQVVARIADERDVTYKPGSFARAMGLMRAVDAIAMKSAKEHAAAGSELTAEHDRLWKKLRPLYNSITRTLGNNWPQMRFEELYQELGDAMGATDADVSEALREAGARGHTYTGETSNAKNYVIYDDAAIETKAMYSRAAALPGSVPNDIEALLERVMAKPIEAMTIRDRARATWRKLTDFSADSIQQGVIDSFNAIKQMEKGQFGALMDAAESPYKAALATKNLPSTMAAVGLRGVPEYKDGSFQLVSGRKGVIEIFQPLTDNPEGNLLPLWELYAAAYRERDVMRDKTRDYTPLFTDSERQKALALKDQYPVLEDVRADWETFNNQLLDLGVERGVLNAEAVKKWKQSFYVPFYREQAEADVEGPVPKRGIEGHGAQRVRKRLAGSEKPLGHVFENLLMNTAYLIDESFKNTAMQKIVPMAASVGAMAPAPEGARAGKDVVRLFENGLPKHYRVLDDLLLRSIANMGYDTFADVFGLFRGSKRLLTGAITLDPAFMAANWVRDTLSAWVTSDAGILPIIDALKGAKAAFSMDSDTLAIMAAGGGGGGVYDMQPAELRTFLVEKLGSANASDRFMATIVSPKNWLKVWRKLGNAAENANRVAIYRAVRAAGGSVAEAAYQARDVLNFSMSGDYAAMRWLTATVPFTNARIQGLYRLYRGAQDNPGAFALKGLMLTAATLALLLRNNDDEEYERLPEWDKDMYWHFFVGGEHFRLPKPFEVGAIFGTIPERMYRVGTGRDSATIAKQRVMAMLGETFAMNPIPQLAKPMIEQYANRSFFTGSPIVGMAEQNLEPEAQYTPWTSDTMRAMAEGLPDWAPAWIRSPQRLEAMLRGYLGATGTYALQAADTLTRDVTGAPPRPSRKLYDMPVVRRFLQDPNPRVTKYADQLYDMLSEANAIFSTINRYREQGRTEDARAMFIANRDKLAARTRLNRLATRLRSINNQMQMVLYNPGMSPEVKRERLDQLTATKNEVTALVAPMAELF
jgi:predicted GNAT family acetyltransferase